MNEYVKFSERLLNALGVVDFRENRSSSLKVIMYITILVTFYSTGVFDLFNTTNDFNRFTENFALLLVGLMGFAKYATLMYSCGKIKEFLKVIKRNEVSGWLLKINDLSIVDSYEQTALKFSEKYALLLAIGCQTMLLQVLPDMLLGNGIQLPFPAVYPFNTNSTATFTIAFAHQFVGCNIYGFIFTTFESWFVFLVHYACGNFSLLQNMLEKIAETDQHPAEIHERIVTCVQLHQNVFKFSKEIEDVFNKCILVQCVVTSVAICVSGYQAVMTGLDEPRYLAKHLSSIFIQAAQLFLYNWCGQLMEEESLGVTHAISRSELYKLQVHHQRDLGLIMLRAQRPSYITAGKFSNLSLATFSNLMKASMSYFTMLTSVQED